jgi:hypothetical protein
MTLGATHARVLEAERTADSVLASSFHCLERAEGAADAVLAIHIRLQLLPAGPSRSRQAAAAHLLACWVRPPPAASSA